MFLESTELTLSHVDLGSLTETSALALFANAKSHRLTDSVGGSINDIVDSSGNRLYPAYYRTHMVVPLTRLLSSFDVWQTVAVGVEVSGFGGMITEERYVLGAPAEVSGDVVSCEKNLPAMTGGTIFVVDGTLPPPQPATPRGDTVAEIPRLKTPPSSLRQFDEVQTRGTIDVDFAGNIHTEEPVSYSVELHRDAVPGHNMMFSRFSELMNYAERVVLTERVWPPIARELVAHLELVERETFYIANCSAGQTVLIDVRGTMAVAEQAQLDGGLITPAQWTAVFDLYEKESGRLLTTARSTKILAIPADRKHLAHDASRALSRLNAQ